MIEGFEIITADLSEEEKELIPGFVSSFKKRVGKENAITSAQIISSYEKRGIVITGPRVRKIINYIRMNYLVPGLVATSDGYYVTEDILVIETYIKSLFRREAAIAGIRSRMTDYLEQLKKRNQNTKQ